jgi:DNA-binding beta-propeller fold protein YncE
LIRTGTRSALAAAAVTAAALAVTTTAASAAPTHRPSQLSAAAPSGTKFWQERYTGVHSSGAFSLASVISPDGSTVFITGGSVKGQIDAGQTLAYSTSIGAKLWHATYNPGLHSNTRFGAVAVSPDGSTVFVTGSTQLKSGVAGTGIIVAYSAATGAQLWIATPVNGAGNSLAVSPDGTTLYASGGDGTTAYNAATGTALWTSTLAGGALNTVLSPDGSTVFVLVNTVDNEDVVALSAATGTTLWSDALVKMDVQGLVASPDSATVYATGAFDGSPGTGTARTRTFAFDATTGATVWTRTFTSPNGGSYGNALAVSPDGTSLSVTGSTTSKAKVPVLDTWAYNAATGASLWQRSLANAGGAGREVAVSPDGAKVFTTADGSSSGPLNVFSTEAYDPATGAVLWRLGTDRLSVGWHSFSTSLGVTPDSAAVIASGDINTPEPGTIPNAVTVAYNA